MNDKVYSSREVAAILGCVPQTVSKWCKKYGIGHKLGTGVTHPWLLTASDIDALRAVQARGAAFMKDRFTRAIEHAG